MPEPLDVLIIGAGLSGIGAAAHLRREYPTKSFTIIESRDAIGGTWDLFRYPGIRSDSDMFTMGYKFKPWTDEDSIAAGEKIRTYITDVASEYDITERIMFCHRAIHADWSSEDRTWTVSIRDNTGDVSTIKTRFLLNCSGYYNYEQGFSPTFEGSDDFAGTIVHPQHWPEDLEYEGKRVVVIGSGATAVTLVPSMAKTAEHVTMLQRSPTYIASIPAADPLAEKLRGHVSDDTTYKLVRFKKFTVGRLMYTIARKAPNYTRKQLRKAAMVDLPADYDYDTHLTPTYNPWDQRLCACPDGDFFHAIRGGNAEIVTATIDRFTPTGIRLTNGDELPADIIVTATGLNIQMLGGMTLAVDGEDVDLGTRLIYKGMMVSGVPNFAMATGYTNASWTLKVELIFDYLMRLWHYMDLNDLEVVVAIPPAEYFNKTTPLLDLKSGYITRAQQLMPQQGPRTPWRLYQNYLRDSWLMHRGPIVNDGLEYLPRRRARAQARAVSVSA